jgi:hypothetical protein
VDDEGGADELTPRDRRALWSWVPWAVAALGFAFAAFDVFFVRPEMLELAASGRAVTGEVLSVSRGLPGQSVRAISPRLNGGVVGVMDPELGWQAVDAGGVGHVGERVPVLCSMPLRRCERAARVAAYERTWPPPPGVARGLALLVFAAVTALVMQRRSVTSRARRPP